MKTTALAPVCALILGAGAHARTITLTKRRKPRSRMKASWVSTGTTPTSDRMLRATLASALIASAAYLGGCGGGGDGGTSSSGPQAIAPGQTVTLRAGQTVLVPAGTTVFDPAHNNTAHIAGDDNTVNTAAGSQVIVPSTATGTPDNTVIAR